jgi:hypothetical protein
VGITRLRGRLYTVGGRQVVPLLHPAAALYNGSNRQVMFDDFRRLRTVLDREGEPTVGTCPAPDTAGEALEMAQDRAASDVPDQPSLF